jgi:hypothetical protein
MHCGAILSEETLDETARLQMELNEQKKTNELLKSALESQLKKESDPQATEKLDEANKLREELKKSEELLKALESRLKSEIAKSAEPPPPEKDNKKSIGLIITLLAVALIVFGVFYYFNIYLPEKIDREAPRYYTYADITNLRSSKIAGADYNKKASLNYGSELITYHHDSEWSEVKDAAGNKGFIASSLLLSESDFVILNNIFGDPESKQNINTVKCRTAILNYYKENSLGSEWKVFCRPKETKPNAVFYPRLYKNSKFTDFAVIIKNTLTNKRKILIFGFNEDESVAWQTSGDAPGEGYIKSIIRDNSGQIYVDYSD